MRANLDRVSTQILRSTPFLLAFITPLFFLPFTSDYFNFNKFYFVSFLASLSLISWCVRNLTRGKLSFTSSPSLLPLIILMLASIISSAWLSPIKHQSLFGQTTLFVSLAIIYLTTTSSQKNQFIITSVVYGLISSATLLSIFSILHHFEIAGKVIQWTPLSDKFFNLTGSTLANLMFTLPVAIATIGMSIATKKWLPKSGLFAAVMLMLIASIINISLLFPQDKQVVIILLPLNASWSIAVDIFKYWQTALFGTGPETYYSTFTRLRPAYLNLDNLIWNLRFAESGSYLLTLITTTGLVGGISFALVFIKSLFVALKHKKQITENPTLVFLSLAALTSFISTLILPASIVTLVLGISSLIALTVGFKILGFKNTKDISVSLSSNTEITGNYSEITDNSDISFVKAFLPWLATVLSVTLVSLYWYYSVPAYQASTMIRQANDLVKTNVVGSFLKQTEATKTDKYNPNYQIILSQTYQGVAKFYLDKTEKTDDDKKNAADAMQRAIDAGRLAATLDPFNANSHENLSNIYQTFIGVADGSADYAVSHLAQAIALDPNSPRLYLQLGILFFNLGDTEQATKLISKSIDLKQNWDVPYFNLSAIYKNNKDYVRALSYMKAGYALTSPQSEEYPKIQEEIKALEKLAPAPVASGSAATQ